MGGVDWIEREGLDLVKGMANGTADSRHTGSGRSFAGALPASAGSPYARRHVLDGARPNGM